jgi:hypothetical protein
VWQNDYVPSGEPDRSNLTAQLEDAATSRDQVKWRPSVCLSGMLGSPLRAKPTQLLQLRLHSQKRRHAAQSIDRSFRIH